MLESIFNKAEETPTLVFSCEYCEIFKSTYFREPILSLFKSEFQWQVFTCEFLKTLQKLIRTVLKIYVFRLNGLDQKLHKKDKISNIYSVNLTKSTAFCIFFQISQKNHFRKTPFFVQRKFQPEISFLFSWYIYIYIYIYKYIYIYICFRISIKFDTIYSIFIH